MKVLTLHQPWASLVALGVKTIETRSWSTQYRGPLAIHAGARDPDPTPVGAYSPSRPKLPKDAPFSLWFHQRGRDGRRGGVGGHICVPLPLGAIVATCTLVDVVPTELCQDIGGCGGGWYSLGKVVTNIHGESASVLTDPKQRPYGDFTPGRYAWLLADVVPVDPPVPFKGGQGLTKTWTSEPQGVAS